jgi:HAD superfamily hydrolase (TIGR01509 family)
MKNVKIALWDLGNVLVRWEPETILSRFGLEAELTEYLRGQLLGHDDWLKLDQGLTTEAKVAERLSRESGLAMPQIERCFDIVRESLTDIPESVELIRQMRDAGIPMFVLSNMSDVNAHYLRGRDYFQWFDGVVISAEEKLIKPDPTLFQRVLDRYSLQAQDVYFIDDSAENIRSAANLGFKAQQFHRRPGCYQRIRQAFALPDATA